MFRDARIHVVIPAYNVADHIADVIKSLPAWVDAITVVDDGSADATAAAALAVGDPRVTVIRHAANQGVGAATISGFGEALRRGDDIAAKMDGDGQMDPAHLPRLLTPIIDGRCDYTKGNRFLFDRELSVMPKHRLACNFVLTFLTKLASGYWNVFDPQNGYLAIHAAALRLLDLERISKRYFFENDMLINLNIFNVRVMDIALPARYGRERSSMSVAGSCARSPSTCSAATGTGSTVNTCCGISRPWRCSCSPGCRCSHSGRASAPTPGCSRTCTTSSRRPGR